MVLSKFIQSPFGLDSGWNFFFLCLFGIILAGGNDVW